MKALFELIDAKIKLHQTDKHLAQLQMLDHNLMGTNEPKHSSEYYQGKIDSLTELKGDLS